MAMLKSQVVPKNSGAAFEVNKGQRLRVAGRMASGKRQAITGALHSLR